MSYDAEVVLHCDDEFTAYLRHDKNTNIHKYEISSGKIWINTYRFTIKNVTPTTQLEIVCNDKGGSGGFIATVHYNGISYPTTKPIETGNWRFISSSDNVNNLKYTPKSKYSPDGVTVANDIDNSAFWIWNGESKNSITFRFDFETIYQDNEDSEESQGGQICNNECSGCYKRVKELEEELDRVKKNEAKLIDILHGISNHKKI